MTVTIHVGNALDRLREMMGGVAHVCFCSPPYYGKRDYGVEPSIWGGLPGCAHVWGDELLDRSKRSPGTQGGSLTGDGRYQAEACRFEIRSNFCVECGAWRGCLGLEPTPELYVEHLVEIFAQVRRVLRADGTLWLNIGDTYATGTGRVGDHPGGGEQGARRKGPREDVYHRGGESASTWSGRPKPGATSRAGHRGKKTRATRDGDHAGINTAMAALGPMTQPNRMPLPGLKPKDLIGIPWMTAFALRKSGWWLRGENIWHKPNPMPESITDRCTVSHEAVFLLSKSEQYYFDAAAIAEPANYPPGSGWKTEAKGTRPGKRSSVQNKPTDPEQSFRSIKETRNKRTVWTIPTAPFADAHFATCPPSLVEPCLKAGTSARGCCPTCSTGWERVQGRHGQTLGWWPGCRCDETLAKSLPAYPKRPARDAEAEQVARWEWECGQVDDAREALCGVVADRRLVPALAIDPFGGAGTTALVADRLQLDCALVEMNPEYAAMARRRIDSEAGLFAARAAE